MSRLLNRRVFGVVLVALLVVTAGCSSLTGGGGADTGGDGGDEENGEEDSGGETTADDSGESSADTTTESGGEMTTTGGGMETPEMGTPAAGAFGDYQFSQGESYTYTAVSGEQETDLTWDVTSVSGDQVTVEVTSSGGQTGTRSTTLEGTSTEVFQQASQSMSAILFAALRSGNLVARGHSLTVGNTWTVTPDDLGQGSNPSWESAEVEVTGTASYAGVQCTNVRIVPSDDSAPATFCVNPDYPFAISYTIEGGENQLFNEVTLSSSSR